MKIGLTIPGAGAGKWCWTGWSNAFKALGHEVQDLSFSPHYIHGFKPDLLINSTSSPCDDFLLWRKNNPEAKVAMNVLAWTNRDVYGINNPGVQATPNNVQYAKYMKADIVFAQYTKAYRTWLLEKWADEGFKLGSMEMAADSTVYETSENSYMGMQPYQMVYVGGYWAYKGQTIDKWLMPVLKKYSDKLLLVGKGWPLKTTQINNEGQIGYFFKESNVCQNMHEPHSTYGGYDVVERVFKTMYCGGLCVSDHVQEMVDGFGMCIGVDLLTAWTPEEYMEKIDAVMQHPEQYDKIRINGQDYVKNNHTYIHRATQLLKDLGC
jgi:hypothetical protein